MQRSRMRSHSRPSSPALPRGTPALRELPLFGLLVLVFAYFAISAPGFLNAINLASIGRDVAVIGMMGMGLTLVVITGGIDLSCASILALSASVMAIMMRDTGGIAVPVAAALAASVALGAGNAFLVTRLNAPPIVATLATLSLYRMQAIKMVTLISPLAPGYRALGTGWAAFLVFAALLAAGIVLLARTRWGRHVYAAGGNPGAARLSGLNVSRTIGWTYVACGFAAGVAGLVAAATLDAVQGNMFMGYELDAVAAVVIGGTSMVGGRGGILGTAIGAALMAALRNGLIVKGLDVFWYQAIIGVAILGVAAVDWAAGRARVRAGGAA